MIRSIRNGASSADIHSSRTNSRKACAIPWRAYPEPNLIPADPFERARVMAVAQSVATDIHPVNNLRVINQLKERFGASPEHTRSWMQHWMTEGFSAIEAQLSGDTDFAFGGAPNIADLCITAQVYNAHRWEVSLEQFPSIARIETNCLQIPAIAAAHPDRQPDANPIV